VAPAAISVTGTDWEWTGAGDINCTGALTVGDGTTASGLTISTTGTKSFEDGVTVNEGATLVVKNVESWDGMVSGAGTLELNGITGKTNALMNNLVDTSAALTLDLTNGTALDQQSADKGAEKWLNGISVLQVNSGAAFAWNPNDSTVTYSELTIKISGAGVDSLAETQWGGALNFLSHTAYVDTANKKVTLIFKSLELTDDATINVGKGKDAGYGMAIMEADLISNGNTLTKVGGGTLNLQGAVTGDMNMTVEAGTASVIGDVTGAVSLDVSEGAMVSVSDTGTGLTLKGAGVFSVQNGAEVSIVSTDNLTGFTGGLDAVDGTLNIEIGSDSTVKELTVKAVTFDSKDGNGTAATVNIKKGTHVSAGRYMSDCVNSTFNIEAGAAFSLTASSPESFESGNAQYTSTVPFLLNNWQGNTPSAINISGSFNMTGNKYFCVTDPGSATSATINIESNGVLNVKGIQMMSKGGNGAQLNVKSGAQLNVGADGIAHQTVNYDLSAKEKDSLILNIEGGATIGILDGATKWETARDLSWAEGAVTFNTQGYKVAANGIGGTREGGAAGTIELKGAVSGSVVKDGIGTLNLLGDVSGLKDVSVNAGTLNITGGISSTGRAVALAAGTTLGAELELNGGALSLDATGTAASLGGNALSFGTEKTALTLSLLDTASSSTPITLLSGIATGLELVEGATLG
ncbi:MAG: hypothetical protein IKK15_03335, partial [Akkermansia sp.]|nr:hypothetical protein [Akkermansia sp.]